MTLRLTKHDRSDVVDRAIAFAFEKRRTELSAEEDALGHAVYDHLFPEKVRKAAKALPSNWLRSDTCLRITFRGMQTVLNISEGLKVPSEERFCHSLGQVLDEELNDRFLKLEARKEDFKSERRTVEANITAVLDRMFTLKQLQESWPEGAAFYEHLRPRESAPVPALQITAINSALGLANAA